MFVTMCLLTLGTFYLLISHYCFNVRYDNQNVNKITLERYPFVNQSVEENEEDEEDEEDEDEEDEEDDEDVLQEENKDEDYDDMPPLIPFADTIVKTNEEIKVETNAETNAEKKEEKNEEKKEETNAEKKEETNEETNTETNAEKKEETNEEILQSTVPVMTSETNIVNETTDISEKSVNPRVSNYAELVKEIELTNRNYMSLLTR
jgi:hypothetical protein